MINIDFVSKYEYMKTKTHMRAYINIYNKEKQKYIGTYDRIYRNT